MRFQSTSPVRGTTRTSSAAFTSKTHFNPRPPCGGRQVTEPLTLGLLEFQSTSPVRGTTAEAAMGSDWHIISIHVPRAGDDPCGTLRRRCCRYFNPRPPCGGRQGRHHAPERSGRFQSTSPVRGTTLAERCGGVVVDISIHVPRAGDDHDRSNREGQYRHFNPRPPCGGRRPALYWPSAATNFNPRPPCGGRRRSCAARAVIADFNPRPPCGGRLTPRQRFIWQKDFNPRPPCGGRRGFSAPLRQLYDFNPRPPCGGRRRKHHRSREP